MAQRFAIDGNFTQSFVGTVKLNASACGTSDLENFASLYYNLDNGSVCYTTASQDFCYEFVYDDSTIYNYDDGKTGINCYAKTGHFQFGASGSPIGRNTSPVTGVSFTKLLFFNSESIAGTNLYGYLTQNTTSGSITLSTTTQEVVFNYTSQYTFDDQIILGSDSLIDFDNNDSTLTNLVATSNYPFTNNERVCVTVSSQGGGSATTYQTGSGAITSLSNLKIIDYDSNVYVTSDPITGQLILQFGSPATPSITSFTVPTSTNSGNDQFNTNRFSGPGSGTYVIDDDYKMVLQYTTASTNTFLSASVLGYRDGDFETLATSTETDGNITFNISDFSATDQAYFESGSQIFRGAVHVRLEDGSDFTTQSAQVAVVLNKLNPDLPSYNLTYDTLASNAYVSNTGNNDTNIDVELGATGSVAYYGTYGTDDDGWTRSSISPDPGSPSNLTITETSTTNFANVVASYTSNGLGTPPTVNRSADKTVSRIVSLRYAAFPDDHFTGNVPTESDLLDILDWTNNGGTVVFQTYTSGQLDNYIFDLTWSGDKYLYVVIDDGITLTQIDNDGFGSIGAFTSGTTTNYKYYRSSTIQAGGASKTVEFKLYT